MISLPKFFLSPVAMLLAALLAAFTAQAQMSSVPKRYRNEQKQQQQQQRQELSTKTNLRRSQEDAPFEEMRKLEDMSMSMPLEASPELAEPEVAVECWQDADCGAMTCDCPWYGCGLCFRFFPACGVCEADHSDDGVGDLLSVLLGMGGGK
mmetsp:Transcript_50699/g.108032  ORF Transcript_50699/g.108032 Transcript_50699/m.108032 type:complete len:151 (-) Transcript_50699:153-605(-)|eukprot:CAMPEP_0172551460 /NCGR_PEP_ID=MMETSP1067-20121228/39668_1 /TAXON_ID=265564 ORGANISM="Thalassiosira punctigera, Strain Tpunct2005C2" /NCGR_SAMPLE_ID=MMETSP1067 /ASSEMBLY_ACC=CAM_ASM_000444 /LENGTH=150 /DNA_ID=CAMNT_0013339249 /DNA_START=142 /DNA_END=594 /DNA_ORIENTATION=-